MESTKKMTADVVILGGGVGGTASALAAARLGRKVILTEETDWIGGQLTSQAVPPDEHPWIEQFGATASYREFRERVREYYRRNYPLTPAARRNRQLNPGNGWVSRLCHEPKVALAVLTEMLAPFVSSGLVTILLRHRVESARTTGDFVQSVTVRNLQTNELVELEGPYFLDATECGDVLPLAGVEYVTGAEARSETGEPAAPEEADPRDMQSFTICFALDYLPGENHTIARPRDYDFWREYQPDFWPDRLLSWTHPRPDTLEPWTRDLFPQPGKRIIDSLWLFRRIIDKENFEEGAFQSDITLVNWPQIDYWLGPIIDVSEGERARHIEAAKQLSLSFLYWMQTEAPRPDGGRGYPGLRLRSDIVGTADGLAHPYIRESRRIKAEFTVLQQHVSPDSQPGVKGAPFFDSVGIGSYRIDLHPSTGGRNYIDVSSLPFQIPLGSLIPRRMENLLAAAKNIGVTHITQGCYRLHPVEWNVGEAAGSLAAFCVAKGLRPREVRNNRTVLREFQELLVREGIELDWPELKAR
ncbi:MAG: FAD-dependent oxidoreductase [Limnochordia bacterium]|jgi:hypothetical protein